MKKILPILMILILFSGTAWSQEESGESAESAAPAETPAPAPEAEPEEENKVKFYYSGDVDADMAFGMGSSYGGIGHALDINLTMGTSLLDKVAGEVYFTMTTGDAADLPAGGNAMGVTKWDPVLAFDGVCISIYDIANILSLDFFDYGYDTGGTSYYFFKNQDLILPLYYPRGLKASLALGEKIGLEAGFGVDQDEDGLDTYLANAKFSLAKDEETEMVNAYFGMARDNGAQEFSYFATGVDFLAGDFLKLIFGAIFVPGTEVEYAIHGGLEGAVGDRFSVAYALLGGSDSPARTLLGDRFTETLMAYVEPGFAFTDSVALGLPLEFHRYDIQLARAVSGAPVGAAANQVWAVPTLYVYPMDGMEIWLWYQLVADFDAGAASYAGLEVIFEF